MKEKARLSCWQKVGVRHYDDFLDRMPIEEAGEIERIVSCQCVLDSCLCVLDISAILII